MLTKRPQPAARFQLLTNRSWHDWLLAIIVLIAAVLYFPLNHGPPHPHILTTALDGDIPLVPVFGFPYLVFLPVFWLTVAAAFLADRNFARFVIAVAIVYVVCDVIYAVYPTYMPRPQHVHGFLSGVVTYIYAHDHPYNDFPSGHTSSAALLALYLWPHRSWRRRVGVAFALLVIPGTLLIKQHSIAGALGGVVLATFVWLVVPRTRVLLARLKPRVQQRGLHDNW
jgi:hypothetical protein